MKTRSLQIPPFAFFLAIFVLGCVAVQELPIYSRRPIQFSHAVHGTAAELSCEDCHRTASEGAEAGMPTPRACRLCHKSKEDFETKLKPFLVDGKVEWTQATEAGEDVIFSHQVHGNVQCSSCHQGIEQSAAVSADLRVSMASCLDCHGEHGVPGDCQTCHTSIDEQWLPPSHDVAWDRAHGQVFSAGLSDAIADNCSLCHTESTCDQCHMQEEPRDHDGFWRHGGHGLAARMDRERCETCHQPDSCDRCHQDSAPRSHRGNFGEPGNNHCVSCHFPLEEEGCATCHFNQPVAHSAATPFSTLNLAHQGATTCVSCHQQVFPIPHTFTGDGGECLNCH